MIRVFSIGIAALLLAMPTTGLGQQASDGVAEGRAMVQAGRNRIDSNRASVHRCGGGRVLADI